MTELCTMYGVSRKTGYKWVNRYLHEGADAMLERSQPGPQSDCGRSGGVAPGATAQTPQWGRQEDSQILTQSHPHLRLPRRSTINEIFKRNGLVHARPKRRSVGHPGRPRSTITVPNGCWSIDFKGQFRRPNDPVQARAASCASPATGG